VIVGRLIPAGTGLGNYTRVEVLSQGGEEEPAVEVVAEVAPEIVVEGADAEDDTVAEAG
jgi:bifunctional ADP-heptose synthase (sugar kinase/adenylyltransferase)